MKKIIILFIVSFFCVAKSFAQYATINPVQIKRELERRGLTQTEVDERLKQKGIDLRNVKTEDAPKIEAQVMQVLDDLEKEKKSNKSKIQVSDAPIEKKQITAETTETSNQRKSDLDVVNKTVDPKITGNAANIAKESSQEIKKSVKEGATVEEAIAEEIIDKDADKSPIAQVYGAQIFRNKSLKVYRNSDDAPALETYIMSTGDQIMVSIWGISQFNATYVINKDGYISPDQMSRIYVKGLTFSKLKSVLRSRFSQYYPIQGEQFSATITYKRTLTVNIYGEVFNSGAFTIPAINTAFNALVAAGGPSDIGSLRNIKLIRAGEKPRTIDVYDFMLNPSVQEKFYLEDNDIISVPIAEKIVTISGAVKRPFKYELIKGENLKKLIEFAGGLTDNAYQSQLQVKRFINDKEVITDVNFKSLIDAGQDFEILAGDVVNVKTIPKSYENFVSIEGPVDFPQKFEFSTGMKIKNLVDKAILQKEARTDYAYLQRVNLDQTSNYVRINLQEILANPNSENNLDLKPKDKLVIYTKSIFVDKYRFIVAGEVRKPTTFPYDPSKTIKVEDAIVLAGGLKSNATDFAYIVRRDTTNALDLQYIRFDVKNALKNPKSIDNLTIQPGDSIKIMSKLLFFENSKIIILGAVKNPGDYDYDESLTLKDVLTFAGGLKMEASTSRIEISRIIIKNDQPTQTVIATVSVDRDMNISSGNNNDLRLMPYDQIIVRTVPEFSMQKNITFSGEVRYPGTYAIIAKNETIESVLQRAGGLTLEAFPEGATIFRAQDNTGYIVMKLDEILKDKNSLFNYILKEGDVVNIPKMKDFVTLKGAIRANEIYVSEIFATGKLNVPFHNNKRARFYVNKYAAGISKDGDRGNVTVLHPNGELGRTLNFGLFKVYPKIRKGDIVTVGYKPIKAIEDKTKKKEDVDWAKTTEKALGALTTILSLVLLVRAVNP